MTAHTLDNTNAEPETRAIWIKLARRLEIPIRCVYLAAPPKLCEHNNAVRALGGVSMNPEQRTMLPRVAFGGFTFRFLRAGAQGRISRDHQGRVQGQCQSA
jgi:bifunctional polynucleotide phosphatase/kinase